MVKKTISNVKKMMPLLLKCKKNIIFFLIVSILNIIISVFSPVFISKILSTIIHEKYSDVIIILLIMAIIKIFNLVLSVLNVKLFCNIRKKVISELKFKIAKNILNMDLSSFTSGGKGKYLQRVNTDPYLIADNLYELKNHLIVIATNVGMVFYAIYLNVYIGGIFFISTLIIFYFRNIGVRKKINYKKVFYEEQEKINHDLTEMFNGMKDVKQLNMNEVFLNKNYDSFKNVEMLNSNADYIYEIYSKISIIIEWLSSGIALLLSVYFLKNNIMNVDIFVSLFIYRKYVYSFADCSINFINQLSEFNLCCDRVFELCTEDDKLVSFNKMKKCIGKIEAKMLSFSYGRENVLNECNFVIKPNELVAIVGKSGSGKTTILNLITKMYKTKNKMLFIDDVDINSIDEEHIRQNISIISQNYYLFDMSIKDNFILVKSDLTDNEMYDACKKVNIHDFIESLPNKYDTIIGEGGYSLSGGQRQRIAIARTLIMNRKIILFDEVTSSLDRELSNLIFNLIQNLKNHTIIVVSHKLRNPELFSKIIVLNEGKIDAIGKHDKLINNCKVYNNIVDK